MKFSVPIFNSSSITQRIFDKVYVVSIPESKDRRSYVSKHLIDSGITEFEFHDALTQEDSKTIAYIKSGLVRQYPPCFRCDKLSCGYDECNNTLIGPQIATFVTYLELWKKIAAYPQRALIVEDDVCLQPYWKRVLSELEQLLDSGELNFPRSEPRLWRMGWAFCEDHDGNSGLRISEQLKMSNPCHAMSSGYAQKLLDNFQSINTTADVFMHRDVPDIGDAVTIFPPIASELSWSKGEFQSLIHPKLIRATYLDRQGKHEEAEKQRSLVRNHVMNIAHK
jgi:GR25 family glycosyltransferase involved in LPS biosynthesis